MASLVLQTINPLDQLVQYYIKIFLKLYYSVSQKMSFLWRFELTQGVTNVNKIDHLYFVSVHSLKFIPRTYGCDHIVLDQQHSQQNSCSVQKYVFNDSNFLR